MLTPEELGRRIVETPPFTWMPGMLTIPSEYTIGRPLRLGDDRDQWPRDLKSRYPDLKDPATKGCLLSMIRVLFGADDIYISTESTEEKKWGVFEGNDGIITNRHLSEEDAILAAFELASESSEKIDDIDDTTTYDGEFLF
jgi:hypothetical protein